MASDNQPSRKDVRYLYLDAWLHNAFLGWSVPESCSHSTRIAQASNYGQNRSINYLQETITMRIWNRRKFYCTFSFKNQNIMDRINQNMFRYIKSTFICILNSSTFIKQKNAWWQLFLQNFFVIEYLRIKCLEGSVVLRSLLHFRWKLKKKCSNPIMAHLRLLFCAKKDIKKIKPSFSKGTASLSFSTVSENLLVSCHRVTGHDVSPDGPEIIKGHLTQRTAVGILRLLVQNPVLQIRIFIDSYLFATVRISIKGLQFSNQNMLIQYIPIP